MAPALQLVLAADSPAARAVLALSQRLEVLALRATPSGVALAGALAATAITQQLTAALAVSAV